MRIGENFIQRGLPDSSCRVIDDTLEGNLIVRIHRQTEIGDDVLYLLALVERQSAINAVRDTLAAERFFKASALGVGAVEDGHARIVNLFMAGKMAYALCQQVGLVGLTIGLLYLNGRSHIVPAVNIFMNLVAVVMDEAVGSIHNGLGAAVVLLQFEQARTLILLLEVKDIVNVGTAEAVDTLRVIAHHAHLSVIACKEPHNLVLGIVGVLILVHQHIAEARGIAFRNIGIVIEELPGIEQYVIKIHCIRHAATGIITGIDIVNHWHTGGIVGLSQLGTSAVLRRQHECILGTADLTANMRGFVHLLVQSHFLNKCGYKRLAVRSIIYGEIGMETNAVGLVSEYAAEDAVESTHPQL